MNKDTPYFENLDGLRTVAFIVVFAAHIAGFNQYYDQQGAYGSFLNFMPGAYLGVSFFFVLSGFLISYLLLLEKKEKKRIDIKQFYWRRVCRIWPVYFAVIIFGFLIIPWLFNPLQGFDTSAVPKNWYYYVFFLTNFDLLHYHLVSPILGVLWSVAIEEQFYLVWPLLLSIIPSKKLLLGLGAIVIMSVTFRNYFYIRYDNFNFSHYHTLGVISDLSLGGIGAYLSFNKKFLNKIRKITTTHIYFIYAAGFYFMISLNFLSDRYLIAMSEICTSLFFLFVLVEQNFSDNSFFKMKNFLRVSTLGKYTYGLYAYHLIAIFLVLKILGKIEWSDSTKFNSSIILALPLSVAISYVSYEFFEKKFLSFKRHRSKVL